MIKKLRKRAPADGGLVKHILAFLKTQQDVWAERRNSGVLAVGNRYITLGEPGTPDITGHIDCYPPHGGHHPIVFAIEVKSKDSRLTKTQKAWHARAARYGIPVCVARSVGEVQRFIEELRRKGTTT